MWQLDAPQSLESEYARSHLEITRSLAGNAETSTWLRLRAMRLHAAKLRVKSELRAEYELQVESKLRAEYELQVESKLQQAEPPTASPDEPPGAQGERKKERKKRKRQQQHD